MEQLRDKSDGIETLLVLPERAGLTLVLPEGCNARLVATMPLRLAFDYRSLRSAVNIIKGTLESIAIIAQYKPDAVVGFGGIESFPVVFFAWFFRIRTLLHEQNVLPGRANRILAKFVDRVAISFEETRDYLNISSDRITFTGNPIRKEMRVIEREEAARFFGLDKDKFTLLVMGGSQGSQHLNSGVLRALQAFRNAQGLQVIHLAGVNEHQLIENSYGSLGLSAKVFSFLGPMEFAYSAADLAVSRAGATSVTELIFFRLPSIIVPYPYAYQHQLANARVLERKGCALIVKDEELVGDVLQSALSSVINNRELLTSMRSQFKQFPNNRAAELLAGETQKLNMN
jgi:UDP-N-acetylglucosamine--N-acetylmuramyl-(pentapeptide) pyrophosphoryl-undecaprenol N-acetylglucosamine transferase